MSIATAIQKGRLVAVYDLRGHQLYTRVGKLYGFTCGTMTIQHEGSHLLTVYDDQGHELMALYAGSQKHGR